MDDFIAKFLCLGRVLDSKVSILVRTLNSAAFMGPIVLFSSSSSSAVSSLDSST